MYRIYWIEENSLSPDCYQYGDAHKAAKAANLGRYRIVRATPNDVPGL